VKRLILSAALGIALLGLGAGGMYYYELRQTPAAIRSACRLVVAAYDDADRPAQEQNNRYPVNSTAVASQYWTAADQAKLEEAVRHTGDWQRVPLRWQNVAIVVNSAADELSNQLGGNPPTGPDPLMLAQAACIGR
jgi:hypothetical protein